MKHLLTDPYVQCPTIEKVQQIIRAKNITNYTRGTGEATIRLDYLESIYREWIKPIVDLTEFQHCYFVNGVTDAIHQWLATDSREWQFLNGDYEYPHWISKRGSKVSEIEPDKLLYISNPTCATGNWTDIEDISNPIILDCAYVGSTSIHKMNVPRNTEQIFFSFSKGWGLIGQRMGLVFTKAPHTSLSLMKSVEGWNHNSVELAIAIVENFLLDETYNMYMYKQREVCEEYNLTPSDCFFIGTTLDKKFKVRRRLDNIARINLQKLL